MALIAHAAAVPLLGIGLWYPDASWIEHHLQALWESSIRQSIALRYTKQTFILCNPTSKFVLLIQNL